MPKKRGAKINIDFERGKQLSDIMIKRKLNVAGEYLIGQAVLELSEQGAIDTGLLAASVSKRVVKTKDGFKLTVGTDVEYAVYVEFGTGVYAEGGKGRKDSWITPKIKIGGKWKHIKTSGSKPRPFLRPLLEKEAQVQYIFARA